MVRNYGGFLPQNEVIKLQWAAVEACEVGAAEELCRKLRNMGLETKEAEWEVDPASLPALDPTLR